MSPLLSFIVLCYHLIGGFSKHGYPGVVIVEGNLEDILQYVRQIQQLRWKFMVVRGEEVENISIANEYYTSLQTKELIDAHRKLPKEFIEIMDMSEAGQICKNYHCYDLFMTAMKKYSSSTS